MRAVIISPVTELDMADHGHLAQEYFRASFAAKVVDPIVVVNISDVLLQEMPREELLVAALARKLTIQVVSLAFHVPSQVLRVPMRSYEFICVPSDVLMCALGSLLLSHIFMFYDF